MDRVEQAHRVIGLVRLQPANAVQPQPVIRRAQGRPFVRRFLHPAFTEVALPGGDQWCDFVRAAGLRYGDQGDVRRGAPGEFCRSGDRIADMAKARRGGVHCRNSMRQSGLEFEGGSDVDRLTVAALVGQGRHAVTLDLVADPAGHREAAGQRVCPADIE